MRVKSMSRKGFTLIELLAVIVILGILMLIAIPSVTRYIETSRQKAYFTSIQMAVSSVKNSVLAEEDGYLVTDGELEVPISNIVVEKGDLSNINGFVRVTENSDGYDYSVMTYGNYNDNDGYCIDGGVTSIDDLEVSSLKKCQKANNAQSVYNVGDTVKFSGVDWYVIADSPSSQDYVTLMKKANLTATELTSNYALKVGTTTANHMAYYWSDTCHYGTSSKTYHYGSDTQSQYNSNVYSGCNSNFSSSKIKEYFDQVYLPKLGVENLKSVAVDNTGYKIRLLTKAEYETLVADSRFSDSQLYISGTYGNYWTMTPSTTTKVWRVSKAGSATLISTVYSYGNSIGVRPIINLRKTSIQ